MYIHVYSMLPLLDLPRNGSCMESSTPDTSLACHEQTFGFAVPKQLPSHSLFTELFHFRMFQYTVHQVHTVHVISCHKGPKPPGGWSLSEPGLMDPPGWLTLFDPRLQSCRSRRSGLFWLFWFWLWCWVKLSEAAGEKNEETHIGMGGLGERLAFGCHGHGWNHVLANIGIVRSKHWRLFGASASLNHSIQGTGISMGSSGLYFRTFPSTWGLLGKCSPIWQPPK